MSTGTVQDRAAPGHAALLALIPGLLVVGLSFSAGGLFPDATAVAAVLLVVLFVARVMLAADPVGGMNARIVTGVARLVALAGWTLVSSAWSGAPGRALLE